MWLALLQLYNIKKYVGTVDLKFTVKHTFPIYGVLSKLTLNDALQTCYWLYFAGHINFASLLNLKVVFVEHALMHDL